MNKIFLFIGNDSVLISERILALKKKLSKNSDLNIENVEFAKLEDVELFLSQGSNLSLFPQNSLLIINISSKGLKAVDKNALDLSSLIVSISQMKSVLIILEMDKADTHTSKTRLSIPFFEGLKDNLSFEECIKLRPWQTKEIAEMVSNLSLKYGLKFDSSALNLFVDSFKENTDLINCELNKLQSYILPDTKVTEEIIKKIYLPSSNIDDLVDLILKTSKKNMFNVLNDLKRSDNFLYMIAVLQNKFRDLLKIKVCLEQKMDYYQISKETGIHSYRVQLESKKISKITSCALKSIILFLSDIEHKVKSGSLKEENALDLLVLIK